MIARRTFDGSRVRQLRQDAGWSQHDLANHCRAHGLRTTQGVISRWESAASEPYPSALAALASVFGVPIDDLFSDDGKAA